MEKETEKKKKKHGAHENDGGRAVFCAQLNENHEQDQKESDFYGVCTVLPLNHDPETEKENQRKKKKRNPSPVARGDADEADGVVPSAHPPLP